MADSKLEELARKYREAWDWQQKTDAALSELQDQDPDDDGKAGQEWEARYDEASAISHAANVKVVEASQALMRHIRRVPPPWERGK